MNYSYQVFNPKIGPDMRANLDASVRLFRNGQSIFYGDPSPVSAAAQAATMRLTISGKLRFKESIAPGDYSLQVIVKDKHAVEAAQSTASQYINFEVRP